MAETDDETYSKVLDLAHFISAPLTALVEADAMAADTFRRFLEDVAFEPVEDVDDDTPSPDATAAGPEKRLGHLRYVAFTYDHVRNGTAATSTVRMPLISLLPLPALQVKEATFDFGLDILAVVTVPEAPVLRGKPRDRSPLFQTPGLTSNRPRLQAAIAANSPGNADSGASGTTAQMTVHVTMQTADLPAGLSQLLNIATQGTSSTTNAPSE